MKITKQELRQIIKEELEAIQQEARGMIDVKAMDRNRRQTNQENPMASQEEFEKFFKSYREYPELHPKNGKVYLPDDHPLYNEINYLLDGDPNVRFKGGDDGDIITFVSQVSENADSEEEIAGTLADTGVADS